MLRNPERMASPLIHPFGLPLLKTYQSLLEENEDQGSGGVGFDDKKNQTVSSCDLASKLTDGFIRKVDDDDDDTKESIWMASECTITAKIREVLEANSTDSVTYTGEHQERVEGRNSQGVLLKGKPDIVQRYFVEFYTVDENNNNNIKSKATANEHQLQSGVVARSLPHQKNKIAVMMTEASVDRNGGEKQKLAQVYNEYARFQEGGPSNQVLIVVWLHFDRKFKSGGKKDSERFERLSITQESWLFVGDQKNKEKARVGFLWREVYETSEWNDVQKTIRNAFMAYTRSLACSRRLSELLVEAGGEWKKSEENHHCLELWQHEDQTVVTPSLPTWRVVSDNVAIENENKVYKIFDNRQHQTWRKLDVWLTVVNDAPWLERFNVVQEFRLEESIGRFRFLGRPVNKHRKLIKFTNVGSENSTDDDDAAAPQGVHPAGKRRRDNNSCDSFVTWPIENPIPRLAYPDGTVCIISYRYFNGTHVASKLHHFLNIAEQIQQMHDAGYIHGDIRNFNMVHPWYQEGIYKENYSQPKEGIKASTLIDFDFSCKEKQKCRYPPGFGKTVIDNTYERCGRPGALLEKKHDWIEFASAISKYIVDLSDEFDGEDTTLKDYREQKDFLESEFWDMINYLRETRNEQDEPPLEIIKKFCDKWAGDCLLKLNKGMKQSWKEATPGSNSPNKDMRTPRSTNNTVQSDGKPKAS